MGWWMMVDDGSEHTAGVLQKWAPDLYRDPVHRWIDSYHIIFPLMLFAALYAARRDELAGLGRVRPDDLRAALDLAGEFGEPHLGLSLARDPRQVDQPLVGRPADVRRRLAQQPPRLPDLGPARPATGGRST